MTVESIENGDVHCHWHDGQKSMSEYYAVVVLELIVPKSCN